MGLMSFLKRTIGVVYHASIVNIQFYLQSSTYVGLSSAPSTEDSSLIQPGAAFVTSGVYRNGKP